MLYVIFLLVFAVAFFLTLQFFPKGERVIRERLVPKEAREGKRKVPLAGLLGSIAPLNRALKLKAFRQKVKSSLASCGSSLSVNEFFALIEVSIIACVMVYVLVVGLDNIELIWILFAAALGAVFPIFWLRQKIRARHNAILKALPNAIDLLSLAVGAGLDFMVAVKKMIERSEPNPLIEELHQVCQETNVGTTRREALRHMARRVNIPEISSFVRTLVQADKMGTGIEEALRRQSEEALDLRFQRGEREALKAPIKMLLPLLVFILPVVLIIVGGPILLQFLQGGFGLK